MSATLPTHDDRMRQYDETLAAQFEAIFKNPLPPDMGVPVKHGSEDDE